MLRLLTILLFLIPPLVIFASPAPAAANALNEWRQAGANSAHSRSLSGTLAPPLRIVWRVKIPIQPWDRAESFVASGDTLYLDGELPKKNAILALDARNGKLRWLRDNVGLGEGSGPIATSQGVFESRNSQLAYLRSADGTDLLRQSVPLADYITLLGQVQNTLYFAPSPIRHKVSFQTLDVPTLQIAPVTVLPFPGLPLEDFGDPITSDAVFYPENIGSLDLVSRADQKISLFMQDPQTLVTMENAPTYRPHVLASASHQTGDRAVGGAGHVYFPLSIGPDYPLVALNPTGKIAWQHLFSKGDSKEDSADYDYAIDFMAVTPTRAFICNGPHLYALNAASGHTVWTANYEKPVGLDERCGPIVIGNVVYVLSSSTPVPKGIWNVHTQLPKDGRADSIRAYSAGTGRLLWSRHIGHSFVCFIGHRSALYMVDSLPHKHDQNRDYFLMKLEHKQ